MKIPDKDTYRRLAAEGKLGNTFQTWATWEDLKRSGYRGSVTVRARDASNKTLFIPFITVRELQFRDTAITNPEVYFQECPPGDMTRVCNLEAGFLSTPDSCGFHLLYSVGSPLNLRHDLEQNGREVKGVVARLTLRSLLGADVDVLYDLWEDYPDAVIEASYFTQAFGIHKSKLIVWEVRDY